MDVLVAEHKGKFYFILWSSTLLNSKDLIESKASFFVLRYFLPGSNKNYLDIRPD